METPKQKCRISKTGKQCDINTHMYVYLSTFKCARYRRHVFYTEGCSIHITNVYGQVTASLFTRTR